MPQGLRTTAIAPSEKRGRTAPNAVHIDVGHRSKGPVGPGRRHREDVSLNNGDFDGGTERRPDVLATRLPAIWDTRWLRGRCRAAYRS